MIQRIASYDLLNSLSLLIAMLFNHLDINDNVSLLRTTKIKGGVFQNSKINKFRTIKSTLYNVLGFDITYMLKKRN